VPKQPPNWPGPGDYEHIRAISPKGRHFVSKYRDCTTAALRSFSKRFSDGDFRQPGPGYYEHLNPINPRGKNFVSKLRSAASRPFGSCERQPLYEDKSIFLL